MKVENTSFYIGESVTDTSNREQGSKIGQSKSSGLSDTNAKF